MSASTITPPPFNVREFARTAAGNHRAELELDAFRETPLSPETLRMLGYLRDLESATMQWLRNVLVTPTHKDARVTAFLVTWAFEKFWIADALDAVVEANDYVRPAMTGNEKKRHTIAEAGDRTGPIRRAVSAIVIGPAIITVHMVTELVDQWVTKAAYDHVVEVAAHPALTKAVDIILGVKARHETFFAQESARRLTESSKAARLSRRALSHAAWPIGAVDQSDDDRTFFEQYVFGGEGGRVRAAAIAKRVALLPGIDDHVASTIRGRLIP